MPSANPWSSDASTQITQLQAALESSRTIGAAVGLVMCEHRCQRRAAFQYLVGQSQIRNVKLRLVAEEVVVAAEARLADARLAGARLAGPRLAEERLAEPRLAGDAPAAGSGMGNGSADLAAATAIGRHWALNRDSVQAAAATASTGPQGRG